jgi:hypothetical protein
MLEEVLTFATGLLESPKRRRNRVIEGPRPIALGLRSVADLNSFKATPSHGEYTTTMHFQEFTRALEFVKNRPKPLMLNLKRGIDSDQHRFTPLPEKASGLIIGHRAP